MLLKKFEGNPCTPKKAFAEHFNVPESTLRGIFKNREAIIEVHRECGIQSKKRSRIQSGKFEEFEKVLVLWFKEARASNIPVNVELLREKAVQLSKSFEMENFSASHGWVEKFKNRHGLAACVLSGESASVNEGNVAQWKEDLAILVNVYEQKNIYNCDETGLSFN
ncbi:Major centromere autoantigen B [Araneus ventricosus]|uniref:Major centromere autoantigen B n=1 Tax=Araneus ventricosus TaxID=182803 RepID=A0A4Y2EQT6_ARAVE|nr:Major centromere autoantigen B [Araneus ventricosus]